MSSLLQNIHSQIDAQYNDCKNIITVEDILVLIVVLTRLKVTNLMDMGWFILIILLLLFTAVEYYGYTSDGFNIAHNPTFGKSKRKSGSDSIEPLLFVAPCPNYLIGLSS